MKRPIRIILLVILTAILSLTMISCAKNPGVNAPPIDNMPGNPSPIFKLNKNQMLTKISNGIDLGAKILEESERSYVSTVYTVLVKHINYTITYKANYAPKRQDSEIYAKIFDNNENMNRVFVYYNKGELFYQLEGQRHSIPDFGITSSFDLFFELITMLDMSYTLMSENIAAIFDPNNMGGNIGPLIDQSRMQHIQLSEGEEVRESIEMRDVNLNYEDVKKTINTLIQDVFGKFERKLDLLTLKYLGFRLSDLSTIELNDLNGDFINVRLRNNAAETIIFEASGNLTDRINTFYGELELEAREGKGEIVLQDDENPYLVNYPEMLMGRFNYGGTLFVPFLDMTYDATFRTILSSSDNTINQVLFTLNSRHEEIGGLFYKDQMLYVDITGINRQLNGAIELEKLNLPKVKFDGLDLALEISLLINDLVRIVKGFTGDDEYGENEELTRLLLENIVSDEDTSTITVTVTKELIQQLYGEDVDLLQLIADKLEVPRELITQILGDQALENAKLVILYNVESGAIGLDLYDGDYLVFELRMEKIDPLPGDTITYPQSFNPDTFTWLEIPDNTILSLQGTLSMQEVSKIDFNCLFGALLGDISGVNTPYTLYSNEQLHFFLDIMQIYKYIEGVDGELYREIEKVMKFEIYKNDILQIGVYSSKDPNYLLVDFNVPVGPLGSDRNGVPYIQKTLKYKIERIKVKEAFAELLGDDNIFGMENVMDMFTRLLRSIRESVSMRLRFVDSSFAFNLVSDTVKELIGLDNLNALIKTRIRFAMTPQQYLNINIVEDDFVTPSISFLDNLDFESIYQMQWHEFAYTHFGNDVMRFKLTYIEDSVRIISGKYLYQPQAKLLDKIVSYYVTLYDSVNGIKVVKNALDPETPHNKDAVLNTERPLQIDPSLTEDLPEKIPVLYDDGTFGEVNYTIEGFDVSNITVSGMPRAEYWLVIGKGSVAEIKFYIAVEVLGRVIVPIKEIVNGVPSNMRSPDLGAPVVDEVTIDPYTYAIRKAENAFWNPLKTSLTLKFEPVEGEDIGDTVNISNIEWDFDFSNIQFNGGVFFTHAYYNKLLIALKVNVKSKIVAYLRFVDIVNIHLPIDSRPYTEAPAQYTVDVLDTSTYAFPTGSTAERQLRLYFEDGTYRIIGTRDHTSDDTEYFKNYLPIVLEWKHATVDYASIRLVGTKAPLGPVDKNINSAIIGNESFTIGVQPITLTILMPSRAEATIGNAGTIYAITGFNRRLDDSYNFEDPIREHVTYTNASFAPNLPLGSFFEYNPYNQLPLPDIIYLDVEQGGENRIQRKGYKVEWLESDVLMPRDVYDDSGNKIKTEYVLRNVYIDEEYFLVRGLVGNGNHKIVVKMIVKNLEAVYQSITFEGMSPNVTQKTIDPYLPYTLPAHYTLLLKNGNEIRIDAVEWFIVLQPNQKWMMQLNGKSYHWIYDYIEYLDAIAQGLPHEDLEDIIPPGFSEPTQSELEYFLLLIEKGEIPLDNRYVFSHTGGTYVLKSYVEASESIIAQEVFLTLNVIPRTVLIKEDENGYTQIDIFNSGSSQPSERFILDTYHVSSDTMLKRLEYLLSMNGEYERTLKLFNNIYMDNRKEYPELDYMLLYAQCYDDYYAAVNQSEKNVLTSYYYQTINMMPDAMPEEIKYYALQNYLEDKNAELAKATVGIYFGDFEEISMNKYELHVRWINIGEIIAALTSSEGAMSGIVLEGYIGYGQVNQQLIRIPFNISRRKIVNFNFNRMTGYDPSIMSVDYRFVYIGNETEATALIDDITDAVLLDNTIPQHEKSYTIFTRLYNYISVTDYDRAIMDSVEESIYHEDTEMRYALILQEIRRLRLENIRTVLIEMHKPMGLTQLDDDGDRIFMAPADYFLNVFSQVSLMFADGTEGYYAPRFVMGNGATLEEQKTDFNHKLLAVNPENVELDPVTGRRYAYVNVLLTHLSQGSCEYPVTIKFKAIVDQKGVVDGYPTESELDPYDEFGNPRFLQGYALPKKITVNYDYSGPVTFGNIPYWILSSPLQGYNEGDFLTVIPVTSINLLNPSIIDFRINLPCSQGEYTYHINFPRKYIGKVMYNAQAEDSNFAQLNIENGIIEINNLYQIYDPTKPLGFDIAKLPTKINPYSYEFGDVQFDLGNMVIDTYFTVTSNNSYTVEWRLTDEWASGRKIDHNGTAVNVNGEIVIEPVLFATAKLYSYYYVNPDYPDQPIFLEQEIELYIKVKPMTNPVIEYDGLVEYADNNYITFDPYDDPNDYGGNLILPKDGLKVYFNGSKEDMHIFDSRAALSYELLMADADEKVKSLLFDALMARSATGNIEKQNYQKLLINGIIDSYAFGMGVTRQQASQTLLSIAYDFLLEGSGYTMSERTNRRRFLLDYSVKLFSENYGLSSYQAWLNLMSQNVDLQSRATIIDDYMRSLDILTEQQIIEDIDVLYLGYDNFLNEMTSQNQESIMALYTADFDTAYKAWIIDLLAQRQAYEIERNNALEAINQEGGIADPVLLRAEIFNRVMVAVSAQSKLDILRIAVENEQFTQLIQIITGKTLEQAAGALLYRKLVIAAYARTELLAILNTALASTIEDWDNQLTASRAWETHLQKTVERGSYDSIKNLIELYMSASEDYSVARLKEIVMNQLINIYQYRDEDVAEYFNKEGAAVAVEIFATVITGSSGQLQNWQNQKAKAEVWDYISKRFENDGILTRILLGENDINQSGRLDTVPIRALSYERLKQSEILYIFSARLTALEQEVSDPDPQARRAEIFGRLYSIATLEEKVMLIEIMMGAAERVTDTQESVTVIAYTQAGHSIIRIDGNILKLYLYLPDGQRIDLILDIFSREIKETLVPNIITNTEDGQLISQEVQLPNIYYIDPYNTETFRLPLQAEFVFESGYNLILDIPEWTDFDGDIFYTRSSDFPKIYYYRLTENSYRGGVYTLTSYLTYGRGANAEKQYFTITVIVLNRTLKEEYDEKFHFDNPISGREEDIPRQLSADMFVDIDLYYRGLIPAEYYYTNFGSPVVPEINWSKTALNDQGITDSDISVSGGFTKQVKGYLYYDNLLLTKTYDKLWNEIYHQYASQTKPMAWESLFEITFEGERIVKTVFAGEAATQIKALDDMIFNELYIDAYWRTYEEGDSNLQSKIDNLLITLKNNNMGLYPYDSPQWYVLLFKDLSAKAKTDTLLPIERDVWTEFYAKYVEEETFTIKARREEKWNQLFAMQGVLTDNQRKIAEGYLNDAYKQFRNSMLVTVWDGLERLANEREAAVMAQLIDTLRYLYGSTEQAKVRAWDFLKNDDRVKGIIGESAKVTITAKKWSLVDLRNQAQEIINEIIFNAFTKTTNEEYFLADFEVVNSLLIDRLNELLDQTVLEYIDEYKDDALQILKDYIYNLILKEMLNIDNANAALEPQPRKAKNWTDIMAVKINEAVAPIDDTRQDVENTHPGIDQYQRDEIVWTRLFEGSGEWRPIMEQIYGQVLEDSSISPEHRYYEATERYRQARIDSYTQEMNDIYEDIYYQQSLQAWEAVESDPHAYGETPITVDEILYRQIKRDAWIKLYAISTEQEQITMNNRLNDANEVYARAWNNYFNEVLDPNRKQLMSYLLAYYKSYGFAYDYIRQNPSILNETEQSLDELQNHIAAIYPQACQEFVIAEAVTRLLACYPQQVGQIIASRENALKREAWYYLVYIRDNASVLTALMPEEELKALSWERLYSHREQDVQAEYDIIEGIFDDIALEMIDKQYAVAYEYLEDTLDGENKDKLLQFHAQSDLDQIRAVLWDRLYAQSDDKISMDAVYNIILNEGVAPGSAAKSRSWERYMGKNETSDDIKALMEEMFDTYLKARVFEQFRDWYLQNSVSEADIIYQYYVDCFKKFEVWNQLYQFAISNEDEELQLLMDDILADVVFGGEYEGSSEEEIYAAAFDILITQLDPFMADYAEVLLSQAQPRYKDEAAINALKADEWDNFLQNADSARLIEMNRIYDKYSSIPNTVYRKAYSLDDPEFTDIILSLQEKQDLAERLQSKIEQLLDLLFMEFTFHDLAQVHNEISDIYDTLLNRKDSLYFDKDIPLSILKRQAVILYKELRYLQAQDYLESVFVGALADFEKEFNIETWNRYYQFCLSHNAARAQKMQDILAQATDNQIDGIKVAALDYLYAEFIEQAVWKIDLTSDGFTDVLKKDLLWRQLFGEDTSSLKEILNEILPIDDNQMSVKDMAWRDMLGHVQARSAYLEDMVQLRSDLRQLYPYYSDNQIDELAFEEAYAWNIDELCQLMDSALAQYGEAASASKHLAWRDLTESFELDKACYDIMVNVRNIVYSENTHLSDAQINMLAFERTTANYPQVGDRLVKEFVYDLKSAAFDRINEIYAQNAVLQTLFTEMFHMEMLYHNNDEMESKAVCWDRLTGMTAYIENTLAGIDPRFTEQELRAFAVNCLLDMLSGSERTALSNAVNNVSIPYAPEEIDAMIYDLIYEKIIPSEKAILREFYEQSSQPQHLKKSHALSLYREYKSDIAVKDINDIAFERYQKYYEELSDQQKLELYTLLQQPQAVGPMIVYTFDTAMKYWQDGSVDTEYARMNIFWDTQVLDAGGDIASIYIGNAYKAFDNEEGQFNYAVNTLEGYNYLYKNRQIEIEYLDFYGRLNIYAGDEIIDVRNYYNELVIDPLNAFIPDTVDAYGRITGVEPDVEINGQLYTYIGKVNISFESRIYDFLYDEEGSLGEDITATVTPGLGAEDQFLNIKVYYLNRVPVMYYVNSEHYTNELIDETLMLYPLSYDNLTGNKILRIDPLNESIYNKFAQEYILPNSLVIMFTDAYADGIISTLFMNGIFDKRLDITDIQWDLAGNEITLKGVNANIRIGAYSVDGVAQSSTSSMNEDFWGIQLIAPECRPERILEVNQQGHGSQTLASLTGDTLRAIEKIDPYNPMDSFPSNVRVEFAGAIDSKLITGITWQFVEGRDLDYLKIPDVITGKRGEEAMYIIGGFTCVSEVIWINFPIKKRHIDISVEGSDGEIRYIEGGTIYLIKDMDLNTQLSRISYLCYNFAEFDQDSDWSEVPLEFLANDLLQIDINKVGVYRVRGILGPINDPNIVFDVVVIDPKLYTLDVNNNLNEKVYYDMLSVAVNNHGVRIEGKEGEEGFLPQHMLQLNVYDSNNNIIIGYKEFNIINTVYDIANKQVIFTCNYVFLDENDDIDRIASNLSGGQELTFTVSIPLETYLYTAIDDSMTLDTEKAEGVNILRHQLGAPLVMSDLPKAVMNKGKPNEFEVTLLWDLSGINVNRAGSYNLYGYYRDYTSSYITKSKSLVVIIDKIDISDNISVEESTIRTYNGLYIRMTPVLPDVLRENGSYAQLRLGREIIVEYITEEKYLLGEFGDFRTTPFKDAGSYYVRITVDDYNVVGQYDFKLIINPIEIDPEDIGFDYGAGSSTVSVPIPNWPQTAEEKNRLYYTQFRQLADQEFGPNVANRAKANAYDKLYVKVNNIAQDLLNNRYIALLQATYPEYEDSEEDVKANIEIAVKAMVWDEIVPYGLVSQRMVPGWPINEAEKILLLEAAEDQVAQEGEDYTDNVVKAQAYDNLYNGVIALGQILLSERLNEIILNEYPGYDQAPESIKTAMLIEAKAKVWDEIVPTGLINNPLVANWPLKAEEKEQLLDAEYEFLFDLIYAGSEKEYFIQRVRAKAYDILYANVYSTAQLKLEQMVRTLIVRHYPLFDTYTEEQQALILVEIKGLAWQEIIPGDTVEERSYIYDGREHMPIVSGLPQAYILGWPQTQEEKDALLNLAQNENINFTLEQAKARAFDNLMQTVYSNIYALEKLNKILSDVIDEYYPHYYNPALSYEEKQEILIAAKAGAWDNRVLPGDTVQEVNYTFNFWYSDMENNGMIVYTRPKAAGTYELTLIIDPELNRNYRLKGVTGIVTTISIRRAVIDQTFANYMVYQGKNILPICQGLHDENGDLPEGVSIEYSFMKDGQKVNYIRDVGQYTFTAVVNGGNNYPSWTVEDQIINIVKKELTIEVGVVESGYLEPLKELNSSIKFNGIVGNDRASMFGYLVCESNVTSKHMVGEYPINFVGFKKSYDSEKIYYLDTSVPSDHVTAFDPVLFNNYEITVTDGVYSIKKANEQAIMIHSQEELIIRYQQLKDGDTEMWYLTPGNYGDLTIDKNIGLTIIGCYDTAIEENDYSHINDAHDKTMAEVKDDALKIVTVFDSITVNRGALTLDIVRINGEINQTVVYMGKNASSLTINRSLFKHTQVSGEGGASIPQNANAISVNPSFSGMVRIERSYIEGFTSGVYMRGGSKLEIINSRFNKNTVGVKSSDADIHIEGSRFEFTLNEAVYLEMMDFTIINSSFYSNGVGIKSLRTNTYDLLLENRFGLNVTDIANL